ncbi:calmodulin calcium-dependent NAD kinase-like isoform X2 [Rhodamnia argentea]|uniref:Calmodulin calcium-dependent NAD kinase-like isoform X2 n=1 Tax=Rhodamnia argentea TaxID=178133 RepID=A0ABM3HY51_9MYRT|nr:calmodulin calcium-dependent NAD kinase-like isoform X2 [Rhodamnia argentea]
MHRGITLAPTEPAKGPHPHHRRVIARLDRTESGHLAKLESFSDYVARQLGFEDGRECPRLSKLAIDYLKRTEGCEEDICGFFAGEQDAESLCEKLMDEFERCILSYFAFHWSQASAMISQVLSAESETRTKLKDFVLAATRKQRFERVARDLKVTRALSTMVEQMKLIGGPVRKGDESTDVMMPVAHSQRSPVLLLIGGGAGAGKSTLIKDILQQPLWVEAASNAVVVEIDAFKETDVIYKALNSKGLHNDMLHTAELVHQSSADAASSLLVTALNEGRDVILDSTLSWEPFVEQTVAMARNVHRHRYRMGVGYKVAANGTVIENYWDQVEEREQDEPNPHRKPYRIELLGIVCDPYLAVVRGIRRAIIAGRAVRVNTQLKSHKRFADAFRRYCNLTDSARLYCTNTMGGSPALIAWKDGDSKLPVNPEEIECLATISKLNPNAESVDELYPVPSPIHEPGSVWNDFVHSPSRPTTLSELRTAVKKVENQEI